MLIEIHGAGFANKGAQLMLETVISKLRDRKTDIEFAISAGADRPPEAVHRLGLKFIWPGGAYYGRSTARRLFRSTISRFAKKSFYQPFGLVTREQVDGLIDISGYAFGDFWGVNKPKALAHLAKFYSSRGKPCLMLPQMFGPFENPQVRSRFTKMASYFDQIYARDSVSLQALKNLNLDKDVELVPDITIGMSAVAAEPDIDLNRVCLVPNVRMTDKGKRPWGESEYVTWMVDCANYIVKSGRQIVIVVHEHFGDDARLANKVIDAIGHGTVYAEADTMALKKYIASSRFVIGARFHSLVGALSSNVPVVAMGWAHKYRELLKDYQQDMNLIDEREFNAACKKAINPLLDDNALMDCKSVLREINQEIQQRLDQMWEKIFQQLKF